MKFILIKRSVFGYNESVFQSTKLHHCLVCRAAEEGEQGEEIVPGPQARRCLITLWVPRFRASEISRCPKPCVWFDVNMST